MVLKSWNESIFIKYQNTHVSRICITFIEPIFRAFRWKWGSWFSLGVRKLKTREILLLADGVRDKIEEFKFSIDTDEGKWAVERRYEKVRLIFSFVFISTYLGLFKLRAIIFEWENSNAFTKPIVTVTSWKYTLLVVHQYNLQWLKTYVIIVTCLHQNLIRLQCIIDKSLLFCLTFLSQDERIVNKAARINGICYVHKCILRIR